MSTRAAVTFVAALLASASLASTALGAATGSATSKGEAGGKGGQGPGSASGSHDGGSGASTGESTADRPPGDLHIDGPIKKKPWAVDAVWETHRLIRQNDLGGAAPNKLANFAYVIGRFDFTEVDRASIRMGFSQRAIADELETGFRFDDIVLSYTRKIPLPGKVNLRVVPGIGLPTSFGAKKAGMVGAGRLGVSAERAFGDLDVFASMIGIGYWMRYDTAEGGAPNPKWLYSASLSAEYHMPFHHALSAGVLISTDYLWLYRVGAANPPAYGVVDDSQFGSRQPVQQAYGGQIFARYAFPEYEGLKSEALLALAQGDPTLGYTSVLHDGVSHTYLFYRRSSEVYLAFSVLF